MKHIFQSPKINYFYFIIETLDYTELFQLFQKTFQGNMLISIKLTINFKMKLFSYYLCAQKMK